MLDMKDFHFEHVYLCCFLALWLSRCPGAASAGARRTLESQLDLSPNARRDQIHRNKPLAATFICHRLSYDLPGCGVRVVL